MNVQVIIADLKSYDRTIFSMLLSDELKIFCWQCLMNSRACEGFHAKDNFFALKFYFLYHLCKPNSYLYWVVAQYCINVYKRRLPPRQAYFSGLRAALSIALDDVMVTFRNANIRIVYKCRNTIANPIKPPRDHHTPHHSKLGNLPTDM